MSRFEYASRLTNVVPGMRALSATSLSRPGCGAWIDPRLDGRRSMGVLNWSIVALGVGGVAVHRLQRLLQAGGVGRRIGHRCLETPELRGVRQDRMQPALMLLQV